MAKRLTFESVDDGAKVKASWDSYYYSVEFCRDLAVRRLAAFLQEAHPDVWHGGASRAFDDYFRSAQTKEG